MARLGLALLIVALSGSTAAACTVPVFRYALERWPPAPYEIVVFHRGPLSAADHDAVQSLRAFAPTANLKVTEADLDGQSSRDLQRIWDRDGKDVRLPHVLLRYPESGPEIPSLDGGALATWRIEPWLDSPARRALFDRLTAGYAGVVLLVLSGEPSVDAAARARLERELPAIARRIELPARSVDGPQVESLLPLRVEFPVVEVARGPEEAALVRMLLASEDGLDGVRGPIAYPVFGRGRALCSLHGKDFEDAGELLRSLEFLCRACSCQVKELNPGVDLLMTGNWDQVFNAERGPAPRALSPDDTARVVARRSGPGTSFAAELRAPPPPGYAAVELHPESPSAAAPGRWRRYAPLGAAGLVVVSGLWLLRSRRAAPART